MGQEAKIQGSSNLVVQVDGDGNTIVAGRSGLELTRYRGVYRRIRTDVSTGKPNELDVIRPFSRAIELIGRDVELASMRDWMHSARAISVRVLTGEAGVGKTRLALELIEESIQKGWSAGFLRRDELIRFRSAQDLSAWNWNAPVLVVVDYAASCAGELHLWLKELASHWMLEQESNGCQRPLRLLLLERHVAFRGDLWTTIFGQGDDAAALEQLAEPAEPLALQPIDDLRHRRAILSLTLDKLLSGLTLPPEGVDRDFDRRLATLTRGGAPLFLMMAAATAARGGFANALAMSANELAFHVAKTELTRVQQIIVGRGIGTGMEPFINHIAAVATLCQGLTAEGAVAVIEREAVELGYSLPMGPAMFRDGFAIALPDESGGIAAIGPDLIGEALLLSVWEHNGRSLPAIARAHASEPVRTMETVIRTCQDYVIYGHRQPLDWLGRVRAERSEDIGALVELVNAMPERTVELSEVAVELLEVVEKLVGQAARESQNTEKLECWAGSLNNLSNWLSKIGHRKTALDAANKAVAIFRDLTRKKQDSSLPLLVISLNTLSSRLSDVGSRGEALNVARDAVTIQRRLASAQPEKCQPMLAACLDTLSNRLSVVGRFGEALDAAKESVALERDLAARMQDGGGRPSLSVALNSLANCLHAIGRPEEALSAIGESVEMKRELAAEMPDAFQADLAGSLNNFANYLWRMGRGEEALDAVREAATLHRNLAAKRPDAFRPDLAMSLNGLSHHLSICGHRKEALDIESEATQLYRELSSMWPSAFQEALCGSLNNLSHRLSDMGQSMDALAAADEAVTLSRDLAAEKPSVFQAMVAMSLSTLSNLLSELERWELAVVAGSEAVVFHRKLTAEQPDTYGPALAESLNNLSVRLSEMGRPDQAIVVIEEAVSMRRNLFAVQPNAFRGALAQSLGNLSINLNKIGRGSDALVIAKEAVTLNREMYAAQPNASRTDLARALNTLSNGFFQSGHPEEALTVSTEAVEVLSVSFLSHPLAFSHLMSLVLANYSDRCKDMGREVDNTLVQPIVEALQSLRELGRGTSGT